LCLEILERGNADAEGGEGFGVGREELARDFVSDFNELRRQVPYHNAYHPRFASSNKTFTLTTLYAHLLTRHSFIHQTNNLSSIRFLPPAGWPLFKKKYDKERGAMICSLADAYAYSSHIASLLQASIAPNPWPHIAPKPPPFPRVIEGVRPPAPLLSASFGSQADAESARSFLKAYDALVLSSRPNPSSKGKTLVGVYGGEGCNLSTAMRRICERHGWEMKMMGQAEGGDVNKNLSFRGRPGEGWPQFGGRTRSEKMGRLSGKCLQSLTSLKSYVEGIRKLLYGGGEEGERIDGGGKELTGA
jgi:hypothetical protein